MTNSFDSLGKFKLNLLSSFENRPQNLNAMTSKCLNAYLGDYTSVCKILGRFLIYIDTRDTVIGIELLMKGYWEIHNSECMARLIKPGMNVIDIGANYGYFTLLMAGLVGNKGTVTSIEANPLLFKLLTKSIGSNGLRKRVSSHNIAVFDKPKDSLTFSYGNAGTMNGRLDVCRSEDIINRKEGEVVINVKGDSLDNIINKNNKIDFIKVDIEGAEELFWRGSERVRQDNPKIKILIEFNYKKYKNPRQFIDSIYSEGFNVTSVGRTQKQDKKLTKEELISLSLSKSDFTMLLLER